MAVLPVATNCFTEFEALLSDQIAASPTFQSWTGTTSPAEARDRIYIDDLPEPVSGIDEAFSREEWEGFAPFALIEMPLEGEDFFVFHSSSAWRYQVNFSKLISFHRFRNLEVSRRVDSRDFKNEVGSIIEDLVDNSGSYTGFTELSSVEMGRMHYARNNDDVGAFLVWTFRIELRKDGS